jgi:hypothetical protein
MRPRSEPNNAQTQRRENSNSKQCIYHGFPPLRADCRLRSRKEIFLIASKASDDHHSLVLLIGGPSILLAQSL